jgi:hypothetical protein
VSLFIQKLSASLIGNGVEQVIWSSLESDIGIYQSLDASKGVKLKVKALHGLWSVLMMVAPSGIVLLLCCRGALIPSDASVS